MSLVNLVLASGERVEVHRFSVRDSVSGLFAVTVLARAPRPLLDLRALRGQPAALHLCDADRRWSGICSRAERARGPHAGAGEAGLSTYEIAIVPRLWSLTRDVRYRVFQHLSIPAIARAVLEGWGMEATWHIQEADHPRHPYRVQYGETDLDFLMRLLEEAGIAMTFADDAGEGSQLVLSDALHESAPRGGPALLYVEGPTERAPRGSVTSLSVAVEPRVAAVRIQDHDPQRPSWPLIGEARSGDSGDSGERDGELELYQPGAFLIEGEGGDDDARHDDRHGAALAARALESERTGGLLIKLETNAAYLRPGSIVTLEGHDEPELEPGAGLLLTSVALDGSLHGAWTILAEAVLASEPYRPPRRRAKPVAHGVQRAVVIGPPGQEIHTDAHGRVRVRFPWDRGKLGSWWVRVAQGWAGPGMGLFALPRVGQEVLVAFLGGDPDQPMVVGRVHDALNPLPVKLPAEGTQSVWRGASSPGGEGWSEIRMEDRKGAELLSLRAERDLGIGVRGDRTEVIGGDETARVEGRRVLYAGEDAHVTTAGDHRERVGGTRSLTVEGDQHQRVGGAAALAAGGAIHLQTAGALVLEGADVTLRGPGGFVRIDAGGVTIDGALVHLQSGGAPGQGQGAAPEPPLVPQRVDTRVPGPRRLPLVSFPGLPPLQVPLPRRKGGPLTPEEATLCGVICLCAVEPAPQKAPQQCVTARLRAMEDASGQTSTIKAEVPYDMSTDPPTPIMSKNDPRRATRGRPRGSKIPDVVIVKDGTRPPTQDNIKKVIEIKFPPDDLRKDQEDYDKIAGPAPFEVFDPARCGCPDREPEPEPQVTLEDVAEAVALTLFVVVAVLNDGLPGGQLDDVGIPPAIARILSRLAPLLRGAGAVVP